MVLTPAFTPAATPLWEFTATLERGFGESAARVVGLEVKRGAGEDPPAPGEVQLGAGLQHGVNLARDGGSETTLLGLMSVGAHERVRLHANAGLIRDWDARRTVPTGGLRLAFDVRPDTLSLQGEVLLTQGQAPVWQLGVRHQLSQQATLDLAYSRNRGEERGGGMVIAAALAL